MLIICAYKEFHDLNPTNVITPVDFVRLLEVYAAVFSCKNATLYLYFLSVTLWFWQKKVGEKNRLQWRSLDAVLQLQTQPMKKNKLLWF